MLKGIPSRRNAIIIAAMVTVVWSTSWIFIKIGLEEIPALPFAGLRYIMAFLFLLPWMLKKSTFQATRELHRKDWVMLAVMGLLTYPLNQGCLFLAVTYLPNTTVNLISNLGPVFIALLGWLWLDENLNRWQFLGMGIILVGALVFFLPISWGTISGLGLLFSFITLFANVIGSVLTRKMLRGAAFPVLVVTGIPMGIGSILLAGSAAVWEWIPRISLQLWGILILLSLINTTIAFTVWNIALQRLTAFEANVIANTMLVQVALLSWYFLGDVITWKMAAGMALVMGGAVLVNLRGRE
jgi:O-acetylserine/cysteine efflux transporter